MADYLESDTVLRAADFLIRGHHITDVLLLAHDSCGYYQHRHGAMGPEFIAEQQLKDLRHGAEELRKAHPALTVHLYFVRPRAARPWASAGAVR